MGIITAEGLQLEVGNGASPEVFSVLRGVTVSRLEIGQRLNDASAVNGNGWLSGVATGERRAVVECEALATDEDAAARLRSLAIGGMAGTVRLATKANEALVFSAFVTRYRETIAPGEVKRLQCRLESSGAVTVG